MIDRADNATGPQPDLAAELETLHAKVDRLLAAGSAPTPRFLSIAHAAVYADVSEESIRRMIQRGDLTPLRPVKGKVVLDRLELERHVLGSTDRPQGGRGTHMREINARRAKNGRLN